MRRALLAFARVSLLLVAPGAAAAQTIRGELVDAATGDPIGGAFVVVVDRGGAQVGGDLTDARGRFRIVAPAPGAYTLVAERIGYRSRASTPVELGPGQVLDYRLAIEVEPVALRGIRVEAERRCVVRPEDGLRLAEVWDEARKALYATAFTEERGLFRFRVRSYEQRLDPATLEIQHEQLRARVFYGPVPFVSLPADDLIAGGFVREDDDGVVLYAPDAHVLMSDAFLDNHCFRLVDPPTDEADWLGLAFQPVGRRGVPGIRGVLWLDRHSAELRRLEFDYVRLPRSIAGGRANGRVEFRRLDAGAWIVERWWIRMPVRAQQVFRSGTATDVREIVVAVKEEGAEVLEVLGGGRAAPAAPSYASPGAVEFARVATARAPGDSATFGGRVLDAVTGAPIRGARIVVRSAPRLESTDRDGGFRMTPLPPGAYEIEVRHPSYGAYRGRIELRPGTEVDAELRIRLPAR